jgi:hypothetical protein
MSLDMGRTERLSRDPRIDYLVLLLCLLVGSYPVSVDRAQAQELPAGGTAYEENFDDGRAAGWSLDQGWSVREGRFTGTEGAETVYGEKFWGEGVLRFQLSTNDGTLLFGQPRQNRYILRFVQSESGHTIALARLTLTDAPSDPVANTTVATRRGVPLEISVEVRGRRIGIKVGDQTVIMHEDVGLTGLGQIGFRTNPGSFAAVDNIVLLSSTPPTMRQTVGTFRGSVFAGEVGDTTRPIPGVTVSLYGANSPYPDPGTHLRSAETDWAGQFALPQLSDDGAFEFFSIREEDPPGYSSTGARSLAGSSRTDNWIEFVAPLQGKILSGNLFWDRQLAADLVIDARDCEIVDGGNALRIVCQVWNKGSLASPSTVLRVSSGTWRAESPVRDLAVGEAQEVATILRITDDRRGRSYIFRAEIDPEGAVNDLYRGNNVAEAPTCEIPQLPDLVVTGPSAVVLEDQRTVQISAEVKNTGGSPTAATAVRVSSGDWRDEASLRELGPDETERIVVELPIADEQRGREQIFEIFADPESRLTESAYRNNLAATEPLLIPHLPDLTVKRVTAVVLGDGRTVNVRIEIENAGGADAQGVVARVASGDWRKEETVERIPAGEAADRQIRLPIRREHRGRSHTFRVTVDPAGSIIELNEQNNAGRSEPLQVPSLPDLTLQSPQAEILGGADSLHILVLVANTGDESSPETVLRGASREWELPDIDVQALAPGANQPIDIYLTIPEQQRGREHTFELRIDPDEAIDETSEENNRATASGIYIRDLPDLALEIAREPEIDRRSVQIQVILRNLGGAPSPACLVRADAPGWAPSDTILALSAGASAAFVLELPIEKENRGRTHRFRVEADPDEIIVELDERNNDAETQEVLIEKLAPIGLIVAIALAVLLVGTAIGLVIRQRSAKGRRKRWQKEATEEALPGECEPCTRICRKEEIDLDLPSRRILHLTARAMDGETGRSRKSLRAKGEGVERLNAAIAAHRRGESSEELSAQLGPVARALLKEVAGWLRADPEIREVAVIAHLEGGEVTCEFTLYHCVEKDGGTEWEEEDRWKAKVKDERDEPIGLMVNLDPSDPDLPERLAPGLTETFVEFVQRF